MRLSAWLSSLVLILITILARHSIVLADDAFGPKRIFPSDLFYVLRDRIVPPYNPAYDGPFPPPVYSPEMTDRIVRQVFNEYGLAPGPNGEWGTFFEEWYQHERQTLPGLRRSKFLKEARNRLWIGYDESIFFRPGIISLWKEGKISTPQLLVLGDLFWSEGTPSREAKASLLKTLRKLITHLTSPDLFLDDENGPYVKTQAAPAWQDPFFALDAMVLEIIEARPKKEAFVKMGSKSHRDLLRVLNDRVLQPISKRGKWDVFFEPPCESLLN